ncbi:response regulator transcription factor [Bifidobacterium porcinum]|uniref:response regulator transcription factor n=1 Tax=Bifidobacterium porcinum TaxID=212365 RepID=UPI00236A7CD0|nr:response regulator transcription factor [Bifidobacterium thermophilum]
MQEKIEQPDDTVAGDDAPITVVIADDDPMICQTMALILQDYSHGRIRVLDTCADGMQAVAATERDHPDVVLMDIDMPAMDGIEATDRVRRVSPGTHVLILTSLSPQRTVERAVEMGAEGFISKTDAPQTIIERIIAVCLGEPQFNQAAQRQLLDDMASARFNAREDEAKRMLDSLPERERETVILAAQGMSNQEIAERMFISERTVKAHLSSASERLSMNRVQLARLVERAGR